MISYIKGTVNIIGEGYIILECSGIGYKIGMPASSLCKLSEGKEECVYTFLSVKEDEISLYGFMTMTEKLMFELLIGVSGIGPKGALGILSSISVDELKMAILAEDAKLIASAKGIGTKTAQRIVIELKGKIEKELPLSFSKNEALAGGINISGGAAGSAVDVLEALGFSRSSALRAVNSVEDADKLSSSEIVNEALKVIE